MQFIKKKKKIRKGNKEMCMIFSWLWSMNIDICENVLAAPLFTTKANSKRYEKHFQV